MALVEFFFDCSSPWTYLGFERMVRLADDLKVDVAWRPILVGGLFNTVNPSVYQSRENPVPAKAAYMLKDLQDWARHCGLKIVWPPKVFPVNSARAMRICIHADRQGALVPFAGACFRAYWERDEDISQEPVLAAIARSVGLDADRCLAAANDQTLKDALRANTEEAAARGAFGSPTIFVGGDDMYFGNDRLPLVRDAILRVRAGSA